MELTAIAQWLNTTFAGYDYAILQALHNLAEAAGTGAGETRTVA